MQGDEKQEEEMESELNKIWKTEHALCRIELLNPFVTDNATKPTNLLEGQRQTISVAGVKMELVSSPGETNDQLFVWYPAGKVLFAGDDFYRSFPNVYAIRGNATARNFYLAVARELRE